MKKLDLEIVRDHFPALDNDWAFFDNAGGSQTLRYVGERIQDYLFTTNVQLGASYGVSQKSGERVIEAQRIWAEAIHARSESEVVFGPSTTALIRNLALSMVQQFRPGDEVIVANCDHEANIGPWVGMEKLGIHVKIWKINPEAFTLDLDELRKLMTEKTRLVAFTHVSNILGTINPIEEITQMIHEHGAKVCVDGVAYAPHRLVDVQKWDVDFYVFSLYKVYGPHFALMFGKQEHLKELPGINHFFIGENEVPYKLQPGSMNYELSWGSTGIIEYFKDIYSRHFGDNKLPLHEKLKMVFSLIASHEETLVKPLIGFLESREGIKLIGGNTFNKSIRVPTVSFVSEKLKSSKVPSLVDPYKIGIRWGDFYARRLMDDLGLTGKGGVVRISMVHYNTHEEVGKLLNVLDRIL